MDKVRIVKWFSIFIYQQMRFVWNLVIRNRRAVSWILELLGPTIFLTRMKERCALSCQDQQISETQATMDLRIISWNARIFLDRLSDNIKEGQIIVGCNVLDNITGTICLKIGWLCDEILKDSCNLSFSIGDKGWLSLIWIARF